MKQIFKYLSLFVIAVLVSFNLSTDIYAATGSIRVSSNKTTTTVGSTVNVSVTVSSSDPLGSLEYTLSYDSSILEQTGGSSTSVVDFGDGSKKSVTYNYTFKTKKLGSTTITVKNNLVLDWSTESTVSTSISPVTITVKEPEVIVLSDNSYLKSLSIDGVELSPAFSKDVFEYNVELNDNIKEITINALSEDSKASVANAGVKPVSYGMNTFEILVTAEKGNNRTYKINVNVKDQNPINVNIDDTDYTMIKYSGVIEAPKNYTETTIKIEDQDVVAYKSDITKLTLVGLKNADGEIELYVYDDSKYTKYSEVESKKITMYFMDNTKVDIPNGYVKKDIKIKDVEVSAYAKEGVKTPIVYVVYGMNVEDGEVGYYTYDSKTGIFSRYIEEEIVKEENIFLYTTIALGCVSGLLLLIIVIILVKNKKPKDKTKKLNKKEQKKLNQIVMDEQEKL